MNIPRHDFQRVCWNKELRMDQTDAAVWQEVCRLLEEPQRLEQEYRQRLHPHHEPTEQGSLEAQMSKLRRGIARLIDSYAEGLIDKSEFEPRVTRLRDRMQHLEAQLQRLVEEGELEEELRLVVGRLETFAANVQEGLQQADFQTRRDIIRALVKRVEVDEQQIQVVFRISPMPFPPSSDDLSPHWQHHGRRVRPGRHHDHRPAALCPQPIGQGEPIGGHGAEGGYFLPNRPIRSCHQQAGYGELLVDVQTAAALVYHTHGSPFLSSECL
jgi:site-specific DNA recombinase